MKCKCKNPSCEKEYESQEASRIHGVTSWIYDYCCAGCFTQSIMKKITTNNFVLYDSMEDEVIAGPVEANNIGDAAVELLGAMGYEVRIVEKNDVIGNKIMTTKPINEKAYVYCHDCKKLLFKGPIDDANGIRCGEHTVTCGKIGYFNKAYPSINTLSWEYLHPKKGCLLHVRGNICQPQRMSDRELSVIPHCCNNEGVMGAGVAKSLKEKWPEGVQPYFANATINLILGDAFFGLTDCDGKIIIANMIGQDGTVNDNNPKPVKYWALVNAMRKTLAYAKGCAFRGDNIVFHCPKFGSDLAGGKWELIEELIKECWVDRGFDVVIYEFEMDETMWGLIE